MKSITLKPDILGAIASTLCIVHCLATPLLFITHVYDSFVSETVPFWWKNLDYLFLIVSFTAIYRSTQTTSKKFMKYALWAGWAILFSLILNEKM
ncbi:MAG: MerC domain-containing protein, partial [Bacteroidota bacterium]|nr:MerC domain-containing protein [Bacteroidota bacterium]